MDLVKTDDSNDWKTQILQIEIMAKLVLMFYAKDVIMWTEKGIKAFRINFGGQILFFWPPKLATNNSQYKQGGKSHG